MKISLASRIGCAARLFQLIRLGRVLAQRVSLGSANMNSDGLYKRSTRLYSEEMARCRKQTIPEILRAAEGKEPKQMTPPCVAFSRHSVRALSALRRAVMQQARISTRAHIRSSGTGTGEHSLCRDAFCGSSIRDEFVSSTFFYFSWSDVHFLSSYW